MQLFLFGFVVGLDNMVVGFNLGIRNQHFLPVAGIVTLFVVTMAVIGIYLGNRAHRKWQRYSTGTAGLLLIGLAIASAMNWL